MSNTRSPADWRSILAACRCEKEMARRILGDITHYNSGRRYESDDCDQLANALAAFRQPLEQIASYTSASTVQPVMIARAALKGETW